MVNTAVAEDNYWEFVSDDECGRHASAARRASEAQGAGSLSSLADDLGAASLVFEFSRAVVPLTGFVVLYIGVLLERWILTWNMVAGLSCVILGLSLFKFGLISGLMPFGESIGVSLPRKASGPLVFLASLLLGILVTFSEPGINSLQLVGESLHLRKEEDVNASDALLLWLLAPRRSFHLLTAVAMGVGAASALGLARLQYRWSMKPLIFSIVVPLLVLTAICWRSEVLTGIVGISWDCGAITTGPATVPIVLSLGVGASHASVVPRRSDEPEGIEGFGIVTLASLLPVITVMLYAIIWGTLIDSVGPEGALPDGLAASSPDQGPWAALPFHEFWQSCRSVGPLIGFLVLVQAVLIREKLQGVWGLAKGMLATLLGLFVFNIGLGRGSMPLGEQSGRTLPLALDSPTLLSSWGLAERGGLVGQMLVMVFGFVAGFIATVIDLEPCGLGETVERLSGGKFTKRDLIGSVAFGVGVGIVLGFAKVLWQLNLLMVLGVGYTVALVLTLFVDEGLCCIAWDSAGVTTGPVTVPLVLSLGVGICGRIGSTDGFGILACASVCPIISVLTAALVRSRRPHGCVAPTREHFGPGGHSSGEGVELPHQ
mmetsp:Transcript_5545/g.14746  ORF Transcript_5545/g.14746 Transcript_5545/m.14746 type:complete len:601 (-) Transcript_5545:53-1855(-)